MALTKVGKEGITGISNSASATALNIDSNGQVGLTGSTTAFDTTGAVNGLQLYYESDSGISTIGPYSNGGNTSLSLHTNSGGGASAEAMNITSSGEITKPLQPAFLAKPSSSQDNLATGSNVTVVLGNEVFDVGSNFASNIFTAPVTGKYLFSFTLYGTQLDGDANYLEMAIVTSNRGYTVIQEPSGSEDVYAGGAVVAVADMDANDTAYARITIGSGATTFDITTTTNFSGALLC
tara:strand:+ start:3074 stop:3781 length:708 start_codon:yes stop_codon:yes gene_type:complete